MTAEPTTYLGQCERKTHDSSAYNGVDKVRHGASSAAVSSRVPLGNLHGQVVFPSKSDHLKPWITDIIVLLSRSVHGYPRPWPLLPLLPLPLFFPLSPSLLAAARTPCLFVVLPVAQHNNEKIRGTDATCTSEGVRFEVSSRPPRTRPAGRATHNQPYTAEGEGVCVRER